MLHPFPTLCSNQQQTLTIRRKKKQQPTSLCKQKWRSVRGDLSAKFGLSLHGPNMKGSSWNLIKRCHFLFCVDAYQPVSCLASELLLWAAFQPFWKELKPLQVLSQNFTSFLFCQFSSLVFLIWIKICQQKLRVNKSETTRGTAFSVKIQFEHWELNDSWKNWNWVVDAEKQKTANEAKR